MRSILGVVFLAMVVSGCGGSSTGVQTDAAPHDSAQVDTARDAGDATQTDAEPDGPPATCAEAGCSTDATCDDSSGLAICTCKPGFKGDGKTCTSVWTLVATVPGFGNAPNWVAGYGNSIYAVWGGSIRANQSFKSFNIATSQTTTENLMPVATDDFRRSGYSSNLVGVGGYLYYIANYGQAYNIAAKSWDSIPYPVANERGEPALGVLNGRIYEVGGRGPIKTVQYFDISGSTWSTAVADYILEVSDAAGATYGSKLYVFGGRTDATVWTNRAGVYDPAGNTWTELPNMPETSLNPPEAVEFNGKIYVHLTGLKLLIYDPSANAWLPDAVPVPDTGYWHHVVSTASGLYLTCASYSDSTQMLVYKLEP